MLTSELIQGHGMAGTQARSETSGRKDAVRATTTSIDSEKTDPGRVQANRARPPIHPVVEDALNRLFRDNHSPLLRFCQIRTSNAPEAEDLVQDAFVAVRRAYPDKAIDELRPLLFTTLRNLTLNCLKSGDTKRRKASVELLERDDRLGCPRTVTPETQLIDRQLLTIAEQVIAAMAPRRRAVLKLHRFEQLTYDEIAQRLEISRSTVKTDLANAIAEVAEALARKSGGGDALADLK